MRDEKMEFTGERMVPEGAGACTFWEHIERYRFASTWAVGKRVLDIASGEGYGSCALLRAGARSVTESTSTGKPARTLPGNTESKLGLGTARQFRWKIVLSMWLSPSRRLSTSPSQGNFSKRWRVLTPGGTVVISTPDKDQYNTLASESDPFHCSEMSEEQFRKQMEASFVGVTYYGQGPNSSRWWSPLALVSRNSPWDGVKGLGRVKRKIWRSWSGRRWDHAPESDRSNPVQAILVENARG